MDSPEELFDFGQSLILEISNMLDGSFKENLEIAHSMSLVAVCSIRVRKTSGTSETFHVLSRSVGGKTKETLPYFTSTFEQLVNGETFDVSLGFVACSEDQITLQPEGCFNCNAEEFCTQQSHEAPAEEFDFPSPSVLSTVEFFSGEWLPILADFAQSFGFEYMYDEAPFILDQVYDSWSDVPKELAPTLDSYFFDLKTNEMKKNPELCLKEECEDDADRAGLCFMHENLCRESDCIFDKEEGAYCYMHARY